MQSLHSPFQHFGERGETGNVAHGNLFLSKQVRRAPSRNDVDALPLERAREFGDPGFVGNGNESADDFHSRGKTDNRRASVAFSDPRSRSSPPDTTPDNSRSFRKMLC